MLCISTSFRVLQAGRNIFFSHFLIFFVHFKAFLVISRLKATKNEQEKNSSLIKKSLIQFQMEDNNLGTLVVVVHYTTIRYIYFW